LSPSVAIAITDPDITTALWNQHLEVAEMAIMPVAGMTTTPVAELASSIATFNLNVSLNSTLSV
jgi:hypothetical protein